MNYQIQGLSIHAEVHGTAEPALVFLHHWGGTSRTWRKVTAELEGPFKTVAYDARGWGKSDKTLAGYKLADLADEALALVKAFISIVYMALENIVLGGPGPWGGLIAFGFGRVQASASSHLLTSL